MISFYKFEFLRLLIFCKISRDLVKINAIVKELGVSSLNIRDEWGYTIAHWAALYGNIQLIQFLLRHNIAVDSSCLGTQGPKPIHWACRKGHTSVIAALLLSLIHISEPTRPY